MYQLGSIVALAVIAVSGSQRQCYFPFDYFRSSLSTLTFSLTFLVDFVLFFSCRITWTLPGIPIQSLLTCSPLGKLNERARPCTNNERT